MKSDEALHSGWARPAIVHVVTGAQPSGPEQMRAPPVPSLNGHSYLRPVSRRVGGTCETMAASQTDDQSPGAVHHTAGQHGDQYQAEMWGKAVTVVGIEGDYICVVVGSWISS